MKMEMATFILCGLGATEAVLAAGARVFSEKASFSPARRRRAVWQACWAWRLAAPPRSS